MTLRNRHDNQADHHGSLGASSVEIEEIRLPSYPAGMTLQDFLADLVSRLNIGPQTTHTFTLDATINKTIQWQLIDLISFDAIIGMAVADVLTIPGHFKASAVKYQGRSGLFTIDAATV
jgi:hypothetical protein